MLDPDRAGLTNTGQPRAATAASTAGRSDRHCRSVTTTWSTIGSPAAENTSFMNALSIITADDVTPDPT